MPSSEDGGDGGEDADGPLLVDVTGCKTGTNSALHGTTVKVLKTVGKSYVVEDDAGVQHHVQIRSTTPSPVKKKTKQGVGGGGGGGGGGSAKKPQPHSPPPKMEAAALMVDVTGCKTGKNSALHGTTVKVLETVGKSYVVEDADGMQHQVQIRATTPSPTKKKIGRPLPPSATATATAESENVLMVLVTGCKTGKNSVLHGTTVKVLDSICKSYMVESADGAQYKVQKRSTMPLWKPGFNPECDGAQVGCNLLRPLMPIPPAVQFWLDDADSRASTDACRVEGDFGFIATMWLIAAVQSAYLSDSFKKAGRKLMSCADFIEEIDALSLFECNLIPDLQKALVALGQKAKQINQDSKLASKITNSNMRRYRESAEGDCALIEVSLFNPVWCPDGSATARDSIRQDMLMPSMAAGASSDYARDWKGHPEHIYVHMLLLIATALNPLFAAALTKLLGGINGIHLKAAPIKSFTRMVNKLLTSEDHRYVKLKPRPAMNIDIVRMLAMCTSPEDIIALVKRVAAEFGGLSFMKCLPELAISDPPAAEARYHMLPVMITVVFGPEGLTVGGLLADPKVRAAWANLRETRPSADVCSEQWQLDHDAAVNALETQCDPSEAVQMHCEVQVVTEDLGEVRHGMHEVYKVVRASDPGQLHADVAKPADEDAAFADCHGPEEELVVAAGKGRITTVKRLLQEGGNNGGGGGGDGGDGGIAAAMNIDFQLVDTSGSRGTSLYNAAQNGHLAVVLELLKCNADPNQESEIGPPLQPGNPVTPLCIAVQSGHLEIVKALLEYSATPEVFYTKHADVMKVLLEHSAFTKDGELRAVRSAAEDGQADVLELLLARNADPNGNGENTPCRTPLYWAVNNHRLNNGHLIAGWSNGNIEIVEMLLKFKADPNLASTNWMDGVESTPLQLATKNGNQDIVAMLRQHGAVL